jgi:hypothetical protein
MKINIHRSLVIAAIAAIATVILAACDGGSGMYEPDPDQPPTAVNMTTFVMEQFATTTDDSDPMEVDDTEWETDEDPTVYDELLQ